VLLELRLAAPLYLAPRGRPTPRGRPPGGDGCAAAAAAAASMQQPGLRSAEPPARRPRRASEWNASQCVAPLCPANAPHRQPHWLAGFQSWPPSASSQLGRVVMAKEFEP